MAEKNIKRWIISGLAAFVGVFILDMLTHGVLLRDAYDATASVWRAQDEMMSLNWLMTLGQLAFGFVFAYFYVKGYEPGKPGVRQGLRFGVYTGFLLAASQGFVWFVVLPIPMSLNIAWLASSVLNCVLIGGLVGLIYRSN